MDSFSIRFKQKYPVIKIIFLHLKFFNLVFDRAKFRRNKTAIVATGWTYWNVDEKVNKLVIFDYVFLILQNLHNKFCFFGGNKAGTRRDLGGNGSSDSPVKEGK